MGISCRKLFLIFLIKFNFVKVLSWYFLLLPLVFASSHLAAQVIPIDTTKTVIEPYELTDVTGKLQETSQIIQEATDFHSDRGKIDEVQQDIYVLDSALQLSLVKVDTATLTYSESNSLSLIFNGFSTHIVELGKILNDRTSDLDNYRKQLKDYNTVWEITLANLKQDNSANTVLANIEDVLARLTSTDQLLVDQIDVIFKSQNGISERGVEISSALEMLKTIESKTTQKIFNIDSSPIWKIHKDSVIYRNILDEISKNGSAAYGNAKTYAGQNLELIIINVIIILVLMFLIIFLKVKFHQRTSNLLKLRIWRY